MCGILDRLKKFGDLFYWKRRKKQHKRSFVKLFIFLAEFKKTTLFRGLKRATVTLRNRVTFSKRWKRGILRIVIQWLLGSSRSGKPENGRMRHKAFRTYGRNDGSLPVPEG
ncbi:hypothetical protein HLQ02_004246 [Shigella flexneri]|nr:hypothetical protein [Shigella flexneri]